MYQIFLLADVTYITQMAVLITDSKRKLKELLGKLKKTIKGIHCKQTECMVVSRRENSRSCYIMRV